MQCSFLWIIARIHKFEVLVTASTCARIRPVQCMFKYSMRFLEFDVLITASTRACTVEPSALSPRVVRDFMVKYF